MFEIHDATFLRFVFNERHDEHLREAAELRLTRRLGSRQTGPRQSAWRRTR